MRKNKGDDAHVSDSSCSLRLYRSRSSASERLLTEAFARMDLTPSGLGGRRRKEGRSVLVARRGRVGDGGIFANLLSIMDSVYALGWAGGDC